MPGRARFVKPNGARRPVPCNEALGSVGETTAIGRPCPQAVTAASAYFFFFLSEGLIPS